MRPTEELGAVARALQEIDTLKKERDEARQWARYYRARFWDEHDAEVPPEPDPEWLEGPSG